MFLYWKKRGAYELEALPPGLAGLQYGAVERFSWSSSLDISEELGAEPCPPEEPVLRCQNPDCAGERRAAKVGAVGWWVAPSSAEWCWSYGCKGAVGGCAQPKAPWHGQCAPRPVSCGWRGWG
ncbi:uncharacterized protein AAGF69_013155 [Amazona ochrocephala]